MKWPIVVTLPFSLVTWSAQADDPTSKIHWGAFIDIYYAYDFEKPNPPDRSFATQAVRHNEFNVNLAFLEAKLEKEKVRGRLALQAGTAVQANYAGEPTRGTNSGPSLAQHLQEAVVGYQVTEGWWLDAGIYFSQVGLEGWISADNWTYSRSLVADYSPYYQTGVRSSWQLSDRWTTQLHLINGWQTISENNEGKTIGTQIAYSVPEAWSLSFSTLLGNEDGFRQYYDLVFKLPVTSLYLLGFEIDYGHQGRENSASQDWAGLTAIQRYTVAEGWAISGRVERFSDPTGVVARSSTGIGLNAWGGSLGIDRQVTPVMLLRGEFRALWASDPVFLTHSPARDGLSRHDKVAIVSLALRI